MPNAAAGAAQWAVMYPRLMQLCKNRALSALDIAAMLNDEFAPAIPLTRNAVIGKVARSGLRRPHAAKLKVKSSVPLPPEYEAPPPLSSGVSIMDLAPHHCRYPVGGIGATMRYCGADRLAGTPYCRTHRTAYQHR